MPDDTATDWWERNRFSETPGSIDVGHTVEMKSVARERSCLSEGVTIGWLGG